MDEDKNSGEHNTVYIGRKDKMSYVLAVVTQLNSGSTHVVIKARGRSISTAVDVVEIVRNKFLTEAVVESIKIGTEDVTNEEGRTFKVSSIEIILKK